MDTCKSCIHFIPADGTRYEKRLGSCKRWEVGYSGAAVLPLNEVIVENDEGWGAMMGPDFGCVLHEPISTPIGQFE